MRPADYRPVVGLWTSSRGVGVNESDRRARVVAYLRRNPGMSWVAAVRGRIIGAVLCGHEGRRGYLHHLAVVAPFRRRGIGTALVDRCLAVLARRGIARCNAFLFASNRAGLRFWAGRGWSVRRDLVLIQRAVPAGRTRPAGPRADTIGRQRIMEVTR